MKNKTYAVIGAFAAALTFGTTAQAASVSGSGCNQFGTVSYTYINAGTSLILINGSACFAFSLTAGEQAALAAVASEGQASGRQVAVGTGSSMGGGTANGLVAAMQ